MQMMKNNHATNASNEVNIPYQCYKTLNSYDIIIFMIKNYTEIAA